MKYFTISEFIRSDKAVKMKIWNGAPKEAEDNIIALVGAVLDPLRERWGKPIRVSSGYRCKALNDLLPNASKTSQHTKGEAADITTGNKTENMKLGQMIVAMGAFDQVIFEETGVNDLEAEWIHVSWKRTGVNRMQILKKVKGMSGYVTLDVATVKK